MAHGQEHRRIGLSTIYGCFVTMEPSSGRKRQRSHKVYAVLGHQKSEARRQLGGKCLDTAGAYARALNSHGPWQKAVI